MADIRVLEEMPWPYVVEWLEFFKIENEAHERLRAEAKHRADAEARVSDLSRNPYQLGRP